MKACSSCKEVKSLDKFQVRKMSKDGLTSSCKSCLKIRDKAKHDKKAKLYCTIPYVDIDPKIAWRMRNGKKQYAHEQLAYAVKTGKIERLYLCESCGKRGDMHGHHDDYSKPLDVIWLCPACHKQRHIENDQK